MFKIFYILSTSFICMESYFLYKKKKKKNEVKIDKYCCDDDDDHANTRIIL